MNQLVGIFYCLQQLDTNFPTMMNKTDYLQYDNFNQIKNRI